MLSIGDLKKGNPTLADIYELTKFIINIFKGDIYASLNHELFMFHPFHNFFHIS